MVALVTENGFPKYHETDQGVDITCQFRCAWGDRAALVQQLMWSIWEYGSNAVCINTSSCPGSDMRPDGSYEQAIVEATWTTRQGIDPVELYSETLEPTTEFLTLDYRNFYWNLQVGTINPDDRIVPEAAPGRLLRGMQYNITMYKRETLPIATLDLAGTVNNVPVTPISPGLAALVFAEETLLYAPPTASRTVTTEGAEAWNVAYKFIYRPNWDRTEEPPVARGWNWYFREETGSFAQLYYAKSDAKDDYGMPIGTVLESDVFLNYPPADWSGL